LNLDQTSATLNIKGKHLDKLGTVSLVPSDGGGAAVSGTVPSASANAIAITASFGSSQLKSGQQYSLRYTVLGPANSQIPIDLRAIVIKTTGTVPAAAQPATKQTTKSVKGKASPAKAVTAKP